MSDSQRLLAEYAVYNSEPAFRELVARYMGLVYSTALRLMDGDAHLAEDIAQMVFVDLARKASGLSSSVQLGGSIGILVLWPRRCGAASAAGGLVSGKR
jgi:hypothetical protein